MPIIGAKLRLCTNAKRKKVTMLLTRSLTTIVEKETRKIVLAAVRVVVLDRAYSD